MKLTISYMTRNRLLGKAIHRVRPSLARVLDGLEKVEVSNPRYEDIVLWISDHPLGHFEELDTGHDFLSVYVGLDPALSLKPKDDAALADFVLGRIKFFIDKADIEAEDAARLRNARGFQWSRPARAGQD